MSAFFVVVIAMLGASLLFVWSRWRKAARADFIRSYMFPPGLLDKLVKLRPELSVKDRQLVARALRQYFLVYLKCGYRPVSMPSQVVDELWHEFILYTKNYQLFCRKAFGRFMHHTPAAVLNENRRNNDGLRRTWWFACLEENINPRKATRLPLLFALDGKWNLEDGFRYEPDCSALRKNGDGTIYCGGDFSGSSSDSSSGGSYDFSSDSGSGFDSSGGSSDSGSSSDGGSGCNGGCSGGCSGGGGGD
ncbi:glycine-rich domain-containing protein [Undibacterium sp.]|uniref:glycine-rich domain-containing protein n=1 Tax=Undibacterium sp. TaxID=1914977 RepID=UPI00374D2352